MTSVSEATSRLEAGLFVGRERELATFLQWLGDRSSVPDLLNVSGRGGVGKTTLLHAFRRIALERGAVVILADARDIPATPEGFLGVLKRSLSCDLDDVTAEVNRVGALLMLDSFEAFDCLTRYLREEFFPRLDTRVRVVIAGRHPLSRVWDRSDRWSQIVRPLRLEPFTEAETREYLSRRGVDRSDVAQTIARAASHNPLALSLAADMAMQFEVRDFSRAPEWRLAVRSISARLLDETDDPALRELLEAAAVVYQFDESTLAATSGQEDVAAAFDQLCRLSIVKPSEHGLQLHDDVRRHVAADLSWRQPARFSLFRSRARAHYRERLRSAKPADREWLAVECLYLWGDATIHQILFDSGQSEDVRIDPRNSADDEEIKQLYGLEPNRAFLGSVLEYQGSRVRIARDDDRLVGFNMVVPVCQESLPILELDPAMSRLLHARWCPLELARLPATADGATSFYLCHLIHVEETAATVRAALLRDLAGLLAAEGTYLCSTFVPFYKVLLETCGFRRVPAAQNQANGSAEPVDGYVLDLSGIGFEGWIEAMIGGAPLPKALDLDTIERELRRTLTHWNDSEWLSRSPLVNELDIDASPQKDVPQQLRERVRSVLSQARSVCAPDKLHAYDAIELAYLGRNGNRKQAARKLATSRATFYRLVRRGVRGLAETLVRAR
jgi:hypothetical protein